MKKLLLILICLFVSFEVKSKETDLTELVKRGGIYYKKFSDKPYSGMVSGIEKGKLKKGIRVGKWLIFFDNGQLQSKQNYVKGKLDGISLRYTREGKLFKKQKYKNGKKEGIELVYNSLYNYPLNESEEYVIKRNNYKNGKLHGEIIDYTYINGKSITTYKNGIKEGFHRQYFENGILEYESFYKNGLEDGKYKVNDKNGKLLGHGIMEKGKVIEQVVFDEKGGYIKIDVDHETGINLISFFDKNNKLIKRETNNKKLED